MKINYNPITDDLDYTEGKLYFNNGRHTFDQEVAIEKIVEANGLETRSDEYDTYIQGFDWQTGEEQWILAEEYEWESDQLMRAVNALYVSPTQRVMTFAHLIRKAKSKSMSESLQIAWAILKTINFMKQSPRSFVYKKRDGVERYAKGEILSNNFMNGGAVRYFDHTVKEFRSFRPENFLADITPPV